MLGISNSQEKITNFYQLICMQKTENP